MDMAEISKRAAAQMGVEQVPSKDGVGTRLSPQLGTVEQGLSHISPMPKEGLIEARGDPDLVPHPKKRITRITI